MNDAMDTTPVANGAGTDTTTKRKRNDSDAGALTTERTSTQPQTHLDILEILKRHDTQPSLLEYEFSTPANGPAQKKAKTSDSSNQTSITEKLRTGGYTSLVQLQQDASQVSKELVSAIRTAEKQDGQSGRPSVDDLKRIQKIGALEKYIKDVAERQIKYEAARAQIVEGATGAPANGNAPSASTHALKSGTVLTLFGNAPTPKQLFSSMQHAPGMTQDAKVNLDFPVEEMSLPNGLSATRIMQSAATDNKPTPTFEDTFAPPYSLPQLHPPKNHKRSSFRDNSVTWEFKDNVPRGTKRGGYTTMGLNTGDWLDWAGIDPVSGAEAPREQRKQRDRALSTGATKPTPPAQATLDAEAEQYEDALFRKCFSSFAPTIDNTKSLVPSQTKDTVWFSKVGSRRFDETFGDNPALADKPVPVVDPALLALDAQDAEFGKMVEELEEFPEESFNEPDGNNNDPDHVLRKISELLETLASYQRIRNSTLTSSNSISRTPISPAPLLASRVGKPDAPAEEEISTYNNLRHEIAYLVLKLPPYMVAKLDGDQLADLGVRTLLPFETSDYKGSMEEDQVTRASKYSAAATASSLAHLTRQTSSTSGQHYSSANSRTPAIGAAANTRYGQTAPMGRTPATAPTTYQRSSSGQLGSYGTPSAAPRSTYGQQYTRPGAPQQTSYGQSSAQTSYYGQQRPPSAASGYGGYSQNYGQATPQAQPRPTYSSSQPLQQFQQRSQTATQNASAYLANNGPASQAYNRTTSPAKSSVYGPSSTALVSQQQTGQQTGYQTGQQTGQQQQQKPSMYSNITSQHTQYGQQPGSGRATPTFPSQPPTPVNGLARPPQALVPRAASGTPQPIAPQPAINQNGTTSFDHDYFAAEAALMDQHVSGSGKTMLSMAGSFQVLPPVHPSSVLPSQRTDSVSYTTPYNSDGALHGSDSTFTPNTPNMCYDPASPHDPRLDPALFALTTTSPFAPNLLNPAMDSTHFPGSTKPILPSIQSIIEPAPNFTSIAPNPLYVPSLQPAALPAPSPTSKDYQLLPQQHIPRIVVSKADPAPSPMSKDYQILPQQRKPSIVVPKASGAIEYGPDVGTYHCTMCKSRAMNYDSAWGHAKSHSQEQKDKVKKWWIFERHDEPKVRKRTFWICNACGMDGGLDEHCQFHTEVMTGKRARMPEGAEQDYSSARVG